MEYFIVLCTGMLTHLPLMNYVVSMVTDHMYTKEEKKTRTQPSERPENHYYGLNYKHYLFGYNYYVTSVAMSSYLAS